MNSDDKKSPLECTMPAFSDTDLYTQLGDFYGLGGSTPVERMVYAHAPRSGSVIGSLCEGVIPGRYMGSPDALLGKLNAGLSHDAHYSIKSFNLGHGDVSRDLNAVLNATYPIEVPSIWEPWGLPLDKYGRELPPFKLKVQPLAFLRRLKENKGSFDKLRMFLCLSQYEDPMPLEPVSFSTSFLPHWLPLATGKSVATIEMAKLLSSFAINATLKKHGYYK